MLRFVLHKYCRPDYREVPYLDAVYFFFNRVKDASLS